MNKLNQLISDIRYELAPGAHTFSTCGRCNLYSARGGGICIQCRTIELEDLVGVRLARKFVNATISASEAIGEMEERLNNKEKY